VGEEASILALVDGEHVVMLAASQDHKRAYDNDEGPNTGGMGAYSPAPIVTEDMWPVIREQVFERTLAELRRRGIIFKGVLYAGLMITADGIKVLEFNVRFGDPETQVVLSRIAGDILPAFEACVDGCLSEDLISWRDESCVTVVLASGGYPGSYEKGKVISGLEKANGRDGVTVFHAGTKLEDGKVVTSGGRVLAVTALGASLQDAVDAAYEAVGDISFDGMEFRTDIAAKAL
jgi:phosphoribosylamine--glycine ligase